MTAHHQKNCGSLFLIREEKLKGLLDLKKGVSHMDVGKHFEKIQNWKNKETFLGACSILLSNVVKEEGEFIKNAYTKASRNSKKQYCIEHGLSDTSDRNIINHRLDMIAQYKLDYLMAQEDKALIELAKTNKYLISLLILEAKFGIKLSKTLKIRKIQLMELENEINC